MGCDRDRLPSFLAHVASGKWERGPRGRETEERDGRADGRGRALLTEHEDGYVRGKRPPSFDLIMRAFYFRLQDGDGGDEASSKRMGLGDGEGVEEHC